MPVGLVDQRGERPANATRIVGVVTQRGDHQKHPHDSRDDALRRVAASPQPEDTVTSPRAELSQIEVFAEAAGLRAIDQEAADAHDDEPRHDHK